MFEGMFKGGKEEQKKPASEVERGAEEFDLAAHNDKVIENVSNELQDHPPQPTKDASTPAEMSPDENKWPATTDAEQATTQKKAGTHPHTDNPPMYE